MGRMLRAGTLNRRLEYQTSEDSADSYNQPQKAWTTAGTFWAAVRSPTGTEAANALQMEAEASHVVTVRYQGFDLSPLGRFLYGTRVFNISAVLNVDERDRQVDLFCVEVVSPTTAP